MSSSDGLEKLNALVSMFGDDKNNIDELSDDDSYYTACEGNLRKFSHAIQLF
jgi:hypothetical protein